MPNFHTKNFVNPKYPATQGKTLFLYSACCSLGEVLISAKVEGKVFFLSVLQTKDGYLIKGDKITRPSNVALLQQALQDFRDLIGATVSFSNIDHQKTKSLAISPYFKTMDFFVDSFDPTGDIFIEVGFGSGRHLLHQAKQNPQTTVIGLEIHKPSIEQVLKQCSLQKIDNILIVDYDARAFMEFLTSNTVRKIFVHFPIPWDKKPHRRVISTRFIEEAKRVLQPLGTLELRTDSDNYFAYSFAQFIAQEKIALHVNKNKDLEVVSKYEDRWRKQEKNIYDITMINQESSQPVPKINMLHFTGGASVTDIKKRFSKEVLRGDGFFVHFEEFYEIDAQSCLLKVSFGSNSRNERSYIHIGLDGISFLPAEIMATCDNLEAHKLLMEFIYGE